jgi:hypothetical protein
MILYGDIDHIARFLQGHAPALFWIEPVHGKSAEVALGVADVGDGELQVTRPAMAQYVFEELENALFGANHWTRKISRGRSRWHGWGGSSGGSCAHPKQAFCRRNRERGNLSLSK